MDSTTSVSREAVDRLTGAAQRFAGAITGQDELTREGELHKQRAETARDARVEQERATAAQKLAEAEQAEREAATERSRLIAEKQRQEELEKAEREGAAAEASVSAQTRRAKQAAQADARRAMEQADAKVQAAQRRTAEARRRSSDLGREARLAEQRAEDFEQRAEPTTFVGRTVARGMSVARLPIAAVERVTGRPAALFDRFEAAALQTAGRVLRSDDLQRQGRAKQAAAHSQEEAALKLAEADEVATQAEVDEQQDTQAAQGQKAQAARSAEVREQELDLRERSREQQIEKTTQARKRTVSKRAAAAEKGQRNRRRSDALDEAEAEQKSAGRKATAARKEQKVVELDERIANSRRTRKTS